MDAQKFRSADLLIAMADAIEGDYYRARIFGACRESRMKLAILIFALASIGSTAAFAADKISESCTGTETVQIGTRPPRTIPYSLAFSADLASKSYCYDKCSREQTYGISDVGSNLIKLADLNKSGQTRRLTFDRNSQALTDYQVFDAGLGKVVRSASATCRATTFQAPWQATKVDPR